LIVILAAIHFPCRCANEVGFRVVIEENLRPN